MSLNFVILRMWGSFLIKKDNCENLTKWILLGHHVQGLTCILQNLWKLSKVGIYFKTSHNAFKSYSCHWDLWLVGYRFHGSISSIIWFLVHISRSRLCFKMDRGNSKSKQWPQNSDKVLERKYFESIWNLLSHDKWWWNTFMQQAIWVFNEEI